jgi:hypothetical protein
MYGFADSFDIDGAPRAKPAPKVEKPPGVPGGSFPMWKSQDYAVAALGLEGHELPSDRVTGLHIRHPDEAPGNTWGHHSFSVLFVRTQVERISGTAAEVAVVLAERVARK